MPKIRYNETLQIFSTINRNSRNKSGLTVFILSIYNKKPPLLWKLPL